jgi:ferredoxin
MYTASKTQTITVKVLQKDRCTLIEVDRDTDLRRELIKNKVDLYTLGGKLRNCGGAGQCGTCIVAVEDGVFNTNGRTPKEEVLLDGKPDHWRLACRTMVHGDITISMKPKA